MMEEEGTSRRPRIESLLAMPADEHAARDALAPLRRRRRGGGGFSEGGGVAAPALAPALAPAPPQGDADEARVMLADANRSIDTVGMVVAVAATLAHVAPDVVRLTVRAIGPFGETVDLFAVGRVILYTSSGDDIALTLVERTRRDARTVAGVAPAHCLQGEWEWDAAAGAFALARGTMAWATEALGTTRHVPAVVADALAAAIRRGDPSMHGVAVQVDSAGGAVWRPVVHNLPVALTARQAWGMSWPHDWDTYRAALDAALEMLRPVSWCEETWLLAPQARDPRIRTVEERGRRAWIAADGEPTVAVRLSRNARAILVARGLLPARDDA